MAVRLLLTAVSLWTVVHAQTFKVAVDHVVIPLTIVSERGEPIGDLDADDFRVFDDGRPVQIAAFGRFRQSIHVLLLLDTSGSMHQSMSEVRSAAAAVLAGLAADDSVHIGTFSNFLRLSPPLSASDHALLDRLSVAPGANITRLYDAVIEGCGVFSGDIHRRVVFVVSDGMDTASAASARAVMDRAAEAQAAIYGVGLSSRYMARGRSIVRSPDPALRQIAEDTGGRYVDAESARDLAGIFRAMVDEVHQQYLLAFTPARADGRLHSLAVTIKRPGLRIRARRQYSAPSAHAVSPPSADGRR
jgi:Ca-activated chloride channel homolog